MLRLMQRSNPNRALVVLAGLFGVVILAFLGGLMVSIVGHFGRYGQFGFDFLLPKIFAGLAALFYFVSVIRAFIISQKRGNDSIE